jgi:hypothetical protein
MLDEFGAKIIILLLSIALAIIIIYCINKKWDSMEYIGVFILTFVIYFVFLWIMKAHFKHLYDKYIEEKFMNHQYVPSSTSDLYENFEHEHKKEHHEHERKHHEHEKEHREHERELHEHERKHHEHEKEHREHERELHEHEKKLHEHERKHREREKEHEKRHEKEHEKRHEREHHKKRDDGIVNWTLPLKRAEHDAQANDEGTTCGQIQGTYGEGEGEDETPLIQNLTPYPDETPPYENQPPANDNKQGIASFQDTLGKASAGFMRQFQSGLENANERVVIKNRKSEDVLPININLYNVPVNADIGTGNHYDGEQGFLKKNDKY